MPGTGTNGGVAGFGRSSKHEPSELYPGPGSHRPAARVSARRRGRSGDPIGVSCGLTSAISPGRTTIVSE